MAAEEHEGHGHSVAAWTGVAIMLVGFAVASLGVARASWTMSIIGAVIVLVGALAWPIMSRIGYGDKHPPRSLYS